MSRRSRFHTLSNALVYGHMDRKLMRKLLAIISVYLLAVGLIHAQGMTIFNSNSGISSPALRQECQALSATLIFTTTISSSGGTTGCTSAFTPGDGLVVPWVEFAGSAPTTSNIAATGATITWHISSQVNDGVSRNVGFFYACSGDITSPTNTIAIVVTMPTGTVAANSSINTYELENTASSGCFDSTNAYKTGSNTSASSSNYVTSISGTLTSSTEFVVVVGANSVAIPTVGACFTGTCSFPTNGVSGGNATEYFITSVNTPGTVSMNVSGHTGYSYAIAMAGFNP
jgi:hypothetical protein